MTYVVPALPWLGFAWVCTFVAVLLLSLPAFFSRRALRYRRRALPSASPETQPSPREPWTLRRILLVVLVGPVILPFAVIFGVPIFLGMAFVALCVWFRSRRYLAYRALRRRQRWFALPRSYGVGFRVFVASAIRPRRAAPSIRHA